MVAQEVRVIVTGTQPGKRAGQRELFTEETISVLVHENGGVIQLTAPVARGQLLLLANVESKREVCAQVKLTRTHQPTTCYVELEFAEPAPRFWGMEFSAASSLLPKDPKDAQAAALVIAGEANGEEAGEPLAAPSIEEVQALKREVEALRGQGVAGGGQALARESDRNPIQLTAAEEAQLPKPALDFTALKGRRRPRARGNFTSGFRGGVLRLAVLTGVLIVTAAGAAWYKNWIPWKAAAKKPRASVPANAANARASLPPGSHDMVKEPAEFNNTKVASDAPVTLPGAPAQPSGLSAQPVASSGSLALRGGKVEPPGSSGITRAAKRATVSPADRRASEPVGASGAENITVPPKLIKSVRALASLDELRDFETGNVVIDAVVGTGGEVHFLSVLSGPPSLRAAAVEAVKQYRYEPATRGGQPIPARVKIEIRFRFES